MDVRKERRQRQYAPKGKRHSRAAYRQEPQKVQQKRRVGKGRSNGPSKC